MRVLITRAVEDAEALAGDLVTVGIESVLAPMLSCDFLDPRPDPALRPAAFIVTSRNGAEALARYTRDRSLPVYAVGDATAERLRRLGFETVESAAGDAAALVDLIARRMEPNDGPLVFLSAEEVAGDIDGTLRERGYDLRRIVAYRSVPVTGFPRETETALREGKLDGALFFSSKTGRTFVSLVERAGLASCCHDLTAFCLSEAVADSVSELPWGSVRVAERPTKTDLLGLITALCNKDD
ncbi:uroporphyrinogen-III synthase [Nisaea sediminum]|uniref:uroporphyrinogen-III synthase n=1 Tax=Nisaea sediminum TaxID=2775867 RepID=UPI001868F40E|nr:uroporphyrinogen-III synthase [Nisaea sediminum]